MIENIKSCAFTGHRPRSFSFVYDENSQEFSELKNKIKNTIIQVCNAGCRVFYCGMAEGVDLWCGETVLELRDRFDPPLEIYAVVPFIAQPTQMSALNQKRYRRIMDAASERFLVSRNFSKNCYQKRNYYMVEKSDALIAVFKENVERSGTAQTIRYARRKGQKIFLISCK